MGVGKPTGYMGGEIEAAIALRAIGEIRVGSSPTLCILLRGAITTLSNR